MRSIIFTKYGSPDDLRYGEMEKPTPGDDEVLVKVYAASINSWDNDLVKGIPFPNRMMHGLTRPKRLATLGIDMAGRVEQAGRNVKTFHPGDEVFGDLSGCGMGAFAEYATARENALTLKPAGMTFEQAAAIPHTATLALQGLVDRAQVSKGEKVLINGAGGGSGTFGVQLAKHHGAEVTAVDHPEKFDMLRELGVEQFIDYRTEDFGKFDEVYNVILDVVTYRSIFEYKRALAPGGTYVMLGGGNYRKVFQTILLGPIISRMGKKTERRKMRLLMHKANKGMDTIIELFEAGKIVPVIDRTFPLSEVPEALRYFDEGHAKGKIVITLDSS